MMSKNTENLEMEIKLDLVNERNFARLAEYLPEPRSIKHQTNYFFDTDNWDLSRAGWALRLRKTANSATITVKGKALKDYNLLTVRPEIEVPISIEQADEFLENGLRPMQLPKDITAPLSGLKPNVRMGMKLQFTTDRYVIDYADNEFEFSIDLDRTVYMDGSVDFELEVELDDNTRFDRILNIIKGIFAALEVPLIFQTRSKFARAMKKIGIDSNLEG
ncbi:MAG: CYTH domain-containing protein [Candidatus Zixiibacteriota bacterium]